jgi:hypothetical protein
MTNLIAEPVKEYPQFEAALSLLPVLPPEEALTLLRRRLTRIETKAAELKSQLEMVVGQKLPPLFVIENEYRLALMTAEQHFIADVIRRVESGWGPRRLWSDLHRGRKATLEKLYRQFGGAPMS